MTNRVPSEIVLATANGDVATVRSWLESGGDANQELPDDLRDILAEKPYEEGLDGLRLLTVATAYGRCDLIRTLVARGAEVEHECSLFGSELTALYLAVDLRILGAARALIESGADINSRGFNIMQSALLDLPVLRAMLIAGADYTLPIRNGMYEYANPEAYARWWRDHYILHPTVHDYPGKYGDAVAMLEGTRLAGSYKSYVLAPFKELLRLRSLLARGRARIGPDAPEAVARLFGGRTDATTRGRARPPTRRHRPPPNRAAGVPDPVFWKVMEYWRLGDWRRPETASL